MFSNARTSLKSLKFNDLILSFTFEETLFAFFNAFSILAGTLFVCFVALAFG
jgi:hypothetical protein